MNPKDMAFRQLEDYTSDLYAIKRHEYVTQGYTIITEDELPLTKSDWDVIEAAHKNLDYLIASVAETGEETAQVKYFRIKKSYLPEIYQQEIWDVLNTPAMYDLYKTVSGLNEPYMDRCQAHIYMENGFLGRHSDISVYKFYHCTSILMLNDDYEGGEFVIYNNEESPARTKAPARSLLLTDSRIDHSVELITKGDRKNVCFFFSEGVCQPE
jgi:hypothetical protein